MPCENSLLFSLPQPAWFLLPQNAHGLSLRVCLSLCAFDRTWTPWQQAAESEEYQRGADDNRWDVNWIAALGSSEASSRHSPQEALRRCPSKGALQTASSHCTEQQVRPRQVNIGGYHRRGFCHLWRIALLTEASSIAPSLHRTHWEGVSSKDETRRHCGVLMSHPIAQLLAPRKDDCLIKALLTAVPRGCLLPQE